MLFVRIVLYIATGRSKYWNRPLLLEAESFSWTLSHVLYDREPGEEIFRLMLVGLESACSSGVYMKFSAFHFLGNSLAERDCLQRTVDEAVDTLF